MALEGFLISLRLAQEDSHPTKSTETYSGGQLIMRLRLNEFEISIVSKL